MAASRPGFQAAQQVWLAGDTLVIWKPYRAFGATVEAIPTLDNHSQDLMNWISNEPLWF